MSELRYLLLSLAAGILLAAGLWGVLLLGQLGQPHPNNQWVDLAYAKKRAIAMNIASPKIIVSGGSSSMFGVDSQALQQALNLPTVNMGVNAGLGLPVIIENTLDLVAPGDIVIMPLEYPLYSYAGEVNQVMNDYYLASPGAYRKALQLGWESLPAWQYLQMTISELIQMFMQTSLKRVVEGYRGIPDNFIVAGTYGPHRLNAQGDQTLSQIRERESWQLEQVKQTPAHHYGAAFSAEAPGWFMLRHFQSQLISRDACLILVPPAFRFDPSYLEDPLERSFYEKLPEVAKSHGLTFLGQPFDFMYGTGAMYDTDYHLVAEARKANTKKLITLLKSTSALEETSKRMVCKSR